CERSILESAEEWDIDLREVGRQRSGRLAEFFASFARFGRVSTPAIEMAPADLARGLPEGPIRFRARLISATPRDEIRWSLGLPTVASRGEPERLLPLSVDLADWVRTSGRTLGSLLAGLAQTGRFEDPRLDLPPCDLTAGLSTGSIHLHGQLRTAISPQEVE